MKPADDDFTSARAALAAAVAEARGRSIEDVDVTPRSLSTVGSDFEALRLGDLIPLYAQVGRATVRGFADADGHAVLIERPDSLAALLDAGRAAKVDAPSLARRVTWLMGIGHRLIYEPEFDDIDPPPPEMPTLQVADGNRVLGFVVEKAGDTGSLSRHRVTVSLGAGGEVDYRLERF